MAKSDILFNLIPTKTGKLGDIILNRPDALNALTAEMFIALDKQLSAWETDKTVKAILIRSQGGRAFCAGGDLRKVYKAKNNLDMLDIFWHEYRLNRRIHRYPKPYISFLNGITMGGGVGISMHGSHRIGTENLVFAMPETGIGFFPDVGGSYFLPRMSDHVGTYLGLTGARLKVDDALLLQIANHVVPSEALNNVLDALTQCSLTHKDIDNTIKTFHSSQNPAPITGHLLQIHDAFRHSTVEEMLASLSKHGDFWHQKTLDILQKKSPMSLKVTLRQLQLGRKLNFEACMQMEYRMVNRFLRHSDFYEGIRALIIDKDNTPRWDPATLETISDNSVESYFAPLDEELTFD